MRKGPVMAALLAVVLGVYFQVRGNCSDMLSADYLTTSLEGKSVEGFSGTRSEAVNRLGPSFLLAQMTGTQAVGRTNPKPHRVMLSWDPGEIGVTGNEIVGYNVYRCNGISTKFSKLNSDPVPSAEYVDEHVRSGRTYYYTTTAVNSSGRQSRPSNVIRVAIPFP